MNIDYNAVIEILKSFLNNKKIEILGISVGEERQVREAIKNLLTAYEKEKEEHKKECHNCDEYTARLGELETENRMLKSELEKEKEKNKEILLGNIENFQKYFLEEFNKKFISKNKLKEMLNGYKKALRDVEEAIGVLKSNLLIVADEEHKKEIEKELTFREEDRISKIAIINLLEDLLKEE